MRHHVEGMVERGDRRYGIERFARRVDPARLAVRGKIAGIDLAVIDDAHLRGQREDIVGAADLVERILLGNAELHGDQIGNLNILDARVNLGQGLDLGGLFCPAIRHLVEKCLYIGL